MPADFLQQSLMEGLIFNQVPEASDVCSVIPGLSAHRVMGLLIRITPQGLYLITPGEARGQVPELNHVEFFVKGLCLLKFTLLPYPLPWVNMCGHHAHHASKTIEHCREKSVNEAQKDGRRARGGH